jgi:hypothetical protein
VLIHKSTPSGLTYVAEWNGAAVVHKMDHLACFVPGMLALGADGEHAAKYITLAQELMHTCVQMYKRQPTGLAPEMVLFHSGQDMVKSNSSKIDHLTDKPMGRNPYTLVHPLMALHPQSGVPIRQVPRKVWSSSDLESIGARCIIDASAYFGLGGGS